MHLEEIKKLLHQNVSDSNLKQALEELIQQEKKQETSKLIYKTNDPLFLLINLSNDKLFNIEITDEGYVLKIKNNSPEYVFGYIGAVLQKYINKYVDMDNNFLMERVNRKLINYEFVRFQFDNSWEKNAEIIFNRYYRKTRTSYFYNNILINNYFCKKENKDDTN